MRKSRWLILAAIALLIGTAGAGAAGFVAAALVLAVPYLIGCMFHPRTIHGACNGKGYHRSTWYPWSTRKCRGCVGGLQVRHGARVVGLQHIKTEHVRRKRTIAKNKQDRTWR